MGVEPTSSAWKADALTVVLHLQTGEGGGAGSSWRIESAWGFPAPQKVMKQSFTCHWSKWGDLNPRHPAPKAGTLPTELHLDDKQLP